MWRRGYVELFVGELWAEAHDLERAKELLLVFGVLFLLGGFGLELFGGVLLLRLLLPLLMLGLVEVLLDELLLEGTGVTILTSRLALISVITTLEVLLGWLVLSKFLQMNIGVTLVLLALCCSLSFLMRSSRETSAIK